MPTKAQRNQLGVVHQVDIEPVNQVHYTRKCTPCLKAGALKLRLHAGTGSFVSDTFNASQVHLCLHQDRLGGVPVTVH